MYGAVASSVSRLGRRLNDDRFVSRVAERCVFFFLPRDEISSSAEIGIGDRGNQIIVIALNERDGIFLSRFRLDYYVHLLASRLAC